MDAAFYPVQGCFARYGKMLAVLLALIITFAAATPTRAQSDLIDPGETPLNSRALANYHVGVFYQAREDHERAIAEFTRAIDGLPGFGYALAARGDSYAAVGSYDDAIRDYSHALGIYPDFVSVLYARGRAYAALGESDLAIGDYVNAIGQMPEYANPYWGLGDLYYEAGEYAGALENYQRYVVLDSNPDTQVLARVTHLRIAFLKLDIA
jgi:tetratricopeptide (TPR) repeat protein